MADVRTPGERIARMRETHRLTREALAERSGISVDLLARIEEGGITPDLAPLVKIARALGARLGTFLDDQDNLGPVIARNGQSKPTVRTAGASAGKSGGSLDFASLAPGKSGRHMEPFLIDISASTAENPRAASDSSHEGEEFIYVLAGSVEIRYGMDKILLAEGDSIYYDSIVPHKVVAAGGKDARILAVVYAPF
jgi:transcriptional regulator with XRE-family HTH domain